jgi:hypothetical protein
LHKAKPELGDLSRFTEHHGKEAMSPFFSENIIAITMKFTWLIHMFMQL